jgi:argininosuccinate lyase
MPQKRNPCSLEVIKAKTSFAHGIVVSLLSVGKALFMGYNRDTQWTKYWIMDLVEEAQPSLPVMEDVIRLLRVNERQMFEEAQEEFGGATPLMEWMVRSFDLPLRKAKMVLEKAVKYSEREGRGKVSYRSLKRALREMKVDVPIVEQDVKKIQRPESVLTQARSFGMVSEGRVREHIASLRKEIDISKNRLIHQRRKMDKAKGLVVRMERRIF